MDANITVQIFAEAESDDRVNMYCNSQLSAIQTHMW